MGVWHTGFKGVIKLALLFKLSLTFNNESFGQGQSKIQLELSYKKVIESNNFPKYPQLAFIYQQWEGLNYEKDSCFIDLLYSLAKDAGYYRVDSLALAISEQLLKLSNHKSNNKYLPKALFRIGKIHELTTNFNTAKKYFLQCIEIGKQQKQWHWAAMAASEMAFINFTSGDHSVSMEWSEQGIVWAKKINDEEALANNEYEKVRWLLLKGETDNALTLASTVLQRGLRNKNLEFDLPLYYRNIANILKRKGDFITAESYFLKSLLLTNHFNNPEKISGCELELGFFYYNFEQFDRSLLHYSKALKLAKDFNRRARLYDNIGAVYWMKHNYIEAIENYQWGFVELKVLSKNSKDIGRNPTSGSMRLSSYKEYLLTLIQDKADTWLDYYKATKTKSHLTNALKTYALADSMIDFMRYEHAGEGSKLFWRQKTRGMYERAIEACYLAGDMKQAFRFFEKSKAVLLADKLNELGANQQLPEADAKRQKSLRDSIANIQNQLASVAANDKKRPTLQSRLERFNDDFEAFRKNLEKTNPAYYRYKYDNSTPGITAFKKKAFASLEGKGAFVSYFVGDSAVYAFTLRDQAKLIQLNIKPGDYQALANEFLNLCANRATLNTHYARYRTLAYSLYQHLWQPLGISEKRVVISSDGEFLPFEALLSSPADNAFLLKKHAISYTYSANFLMKNNTPRKTGLRSNSFVGFAPETFAASLKQATLNGSKAALKAVENTFFFGKTFTNTKATKAQFLHSAPNARVIQLFTHAEAGPTEAAEPTIYFQDASLRLSELNQTEGFNAQLLVLSACKTGVGQNQRGEGVFSLARGFAALGIGSTVTTLWNVEDQPTYELTKLFYNYLDEGLSKDEALQRAKLDWLEKGGKADALPSQWAGMILVGDIQPLAVNRYPLILGGSMVLLLVGGAIWWRRKRRPIKN